MDFFFFFNDFNKKENEEGKMTLEEDHSKHLDWKSRPLYCDKSTYNELLFVVARAKQV